MPFSNRYQNENVIRVFCHISSQCRQRDPADGPNLQAGSDGGELAGIGARNGKLLAVAHPPYGEMLQLSPASKIHFLFNPRSIRVDGCDAQLKRLGYLTRRPPTPD